MTIRLCARCGETITGNGIKFCTECAHKAYRERESAYNKRISKHRRGLMKSWRDRPKCSCCGQQPVATGNRFLCSKCYQENGDGWIERQSEADAEYNREYKRKKMLEKYQARLEKVLKKIREDAAKPGKGGHKAVVAA